jgi:hypothetical protein
MGENVLAPVNASAIVHRDVNAGSNGLGIDVKAFAGAGV